MPDIAVSFEPKHSFRTAHSLAGAHYKEGELKLNLSNPCHIEVSVYHIDSVSKPVRDCIYDSEADPGILSLTIDKPVIGNFIMIKVNNLAGDILSIS